jgi:hypothetical protein
MNHDKSPRSVHGRRTSPPSSGIHPQSIEVHIDELVLQGFAPGLRRDIATAVEHALVRLLTGQGLPPLLAQSYVAPRLDGGSFKVTADANSEAIGRQVAQAVYRGLSR